MHGKEKLFPALLAIPSIAVCGAFAGALFATQVLPSPGDGWDQIAQALGGLMLGALVGMVLAIGTVLRASPRVLWRVGVVSFLVALLASTLAYLRRPVPQAEPDLGPSLPTVPVEPGAD